MKRLRIYVSKADIVNGSRMSPSRCPIARAVQRRGYPLATVGGYSVALHRATPKRRGEEAIMLPPVAQDFIAAFDSGLYYNRSLVRPFGFVITVPDLST